MNKNVTVAILAVFSLTQAMSQNTFPSTGDVGIGTTSPTATLDVRGTIEAKPTTATGVQQRVSVYNVYTDPNNYERFSMYYSANVAILKAENAGSGAARALQILTNSGDLQLHDGNSRFRITSGIVQVGNRQLWELRDLIFQTDNTYDVGASAASRPRTGYFGTSVVTPLVTTGQIQVSGNLFSSGKIAIGETDMVKIGNYSLAVNGEAIFTKARVKLNSNWPDYVFNADYQLLPLTELESFITANKHLPGIPSQQEISKQGIDLGDNQSLLLKKIEELTLYLIEQNKTINRMQEKINALEKK